MSKKLKTETFIQEVRSGRKDFSNERMSGLNLTGCTLMDICFNNSIFDEANIRGSIFINAFFFNADFKDSTIFSSTFLDCVFAWSTISHSNIMISDFFKSNFVDAVIRDCILVGVNFREGKLAATNWSNVIFDLVNFRRTDLTNSVFIDSKIKNSKTIKTLTANAKLSNVERKCCFEGVQENLFS